MRPSWQRYSLRILALFCFCGGPLFFLDQRYNGEDISKATFIIYFIPVAMALFGSMALLDNDEPNDTLKCIIVYSGLFGMIILAGESLYAYMTLAMSNNFQNEKINEDKTLLVIGCYVTFATTVLYIYLFRNSNRSFSSSLQTEYERTIATMYCDEGEKGSNNSNTIEIQNLNASTTTKNDQMGEGTTFTTPEGNTFTLPAGMNVVD